MLYSWMFFIKIKKFSCVIIRLYCEETIAGYLNNSTRIFIPRNTNTFSRGNFSFIGHFKVDDLRKRHGYYHCPGIAGEDKGEHTENVVQTPNLRRNQWSKFSSNKPRWTIYCDIWVSPKIGMFCVHKNRIYSYFSYHGNDRHGWGNCDFCSAEK